MAGYKYSAAATVIDNRAARNDPCGMTETPQNGRPATEPGPRVLYLPPGDCPTPGYCATAGACSSHGEPGCGCDS